MQRQECVIHDNIHWSPSHSPMQLSQLVLDAKHFNNGSLLIDAGIGVILC